MYWTIILHINFYIDINKNKILFKYIFYDKTLTFENIGM